MGIIGNDVCLWQTRMHVRGYGYGYVSDGPKFASIISVCHRKYIFLTRDGKMVRRKSRYRILHITLSTRRWMEGAADILELKSLNGDDFFSSDLYLFYRFKDTVNTIPTTKIVSRWVLQNIIQNHKNVFPIEVISTSRKEYYWMSRISDSWRWCRQILLCAVLKLM